MKTKCSLSTELFSEKTELLLTNHLARNSQGILKRWPSKVTSFWWIKKPEPAISFLSNFNTRNSGLITLFFHNWRPMTTSWEAALFSTAQLTHVLTQIKISGSCCTQRKSLWPVLPVQTNLHGWLQRAEPGTGPFLVCAVTADRKNT